jgi:hypothetical protein
VEPRRVRVEVLAVGTALVRGDREAHQLAVLRRDLALFEGVPPERRPLGDEGEDGFAFSGRVRSGRYASLNGATGLRSPRATERSCAVVTRPDKNWTWCPNPRPNPVGD